MASKASPRGIYGDALRTLIDAPRFIFVLAIVLLMFDFAMSIGARLRPSSVHDGAVIAASMGVLRALMRAWLRPGYLRALSAMQTDDPVKLDSIVPPLGAFLGAFLIYVLAGLISIASMVVGALPGLVLVLVSAHYDRLELVKPGLALAGVGAMVVFLYAWLAVRFGEHALALEGYGPYRALARSWNLARGRRMEILRVQLFASVVELAGVLAGILCFGIGIILAVPAARVVGDHALVAQYRKLKALADERAAMMAADGSFAGARNAA